MRPLDSVFEEIDMLVQKYGIKRLTLSDELFTVKPERLVEFCRRIRPYNLKWRASLRIGDNLTLELLRQMRDSGCVMILFGLESADDRILKNMRKGITVAQIERCLTLTREAGVDVTGNFIFGDPAETLETVRNTLDWLNSHRDIVTHTYLGIINVYPGSALYDDCVKNGRIQNPIEHIKGGCKAFNNSMMTDDEYDYVVRELIPRTFERLLKDNTPVTFIPDTDKYIIAWDCPYCGKKVNKSIESKDIYKSRPYEIICAHCKHTSTANLALEYCGYIEGAINKVIEKCGRDNKIVFWGTGWFLRSLFARMPKLKEYTGDNAPFVLCDAELTKQGAPIFGHKVYSPSDAVTKHNIKLCIITNMFYEDVKRTIVQKYPQITAIATHEIGMIQNIDSIIKGEFL